MKNGHGVDSDYILSDDTNKEECQNFQLIFFPDSASFAFPFSDMKMCIRDLFG